MTFSTWIGCCCCDLFCEHVYIFLICLTQSHEIWTKSSIMRSKAGRLGRNVYCVHTAEIVILSFGFVVLECGQWFLRLKSINLVGVKWSGHLHSWFSVAANIIEDSHPVCDVTKHCKNTRTHLSMHLFMQVVSIMVISILGACIFMAFQIVIVIYFHLYALKRKHFRIHLNANTRLDTQPPQDRQKKYWHQL